MTTRAYILLPILWLATLAGAFLIGMQWHSKPAPSTTSTTVLVKEQSTAAATAQQLVDAEEALDAEEDGGAGDSGRNDSSSSYFMDKSIPVAERLTKILEMDDPQLKMKYFLRLVKTLQNPADYQDAMARLMDGFEPRGRGRELSILTSAWAKMDPQGAIEFATKGDDWTNRYAAYSAVSAWARKSPDEAIAYANANSEKFKDEDGANWLVTGIVATLAKKDLERATELALTQPRSRARGEMMESIVDGFFKQRGADATQSWAASLEEGPFKDGTLRKVAWTLTEKDPASSASWIAGLPDNGGKFNAMNDLMDRWAEKDPNAAGTWLSAYPTSEQTDEPRQTFAWKIREKDPESALAWAGTIANAERREKVTVEIARDWHKREPEAALQFIEQNSPQIKDRIIRRAGG